MTTTEVPLIDQTTARTVPILANPLAGPRNRSEATRALAAALAERGFKPEVYWEREPYRQAVRSCPVEDLYAQVAVGGDGTLAWVVNSQPAVPVALLPLGSENLLARHLGIGRDPAALADIVAKGHCRSFDLGRAGDRYFALMASVGFDADIIDQVHLDRNGSVTKWTYTRTVWRRLFDYDWPELAIFLDDDPTPIILHQVFVFNFPRYALNLGVCPQADPADGWLDIVGIKRPGGRALAWALARAACGRLTEQAGYLVRRARTVRVSANRAVAVQADGDASGTAPLTIEIADPLLRLLVPPVGPGGMRR